eukprot:3849708-Pyramimonas_sp.AAC.1
MLEQGRARFFPRFALRAALDSYRWPRRLLMGKAVGDAIAPGRAIIAGASTAIVDVKAYLLP